MFYQNRKNLYVTVYFSQLISSFLFSKFPFFLLIVDFLPIHYRLIIDCILFCPPKWIFISYWIPQGDGWKYRDDATVIYDTVMVISFEERIWQVLEVIRIMPLSWHNWYNLWMVVSKIGRASCRERV